jgi:hypothetical protein
MVPATSVLSTPTGNETRAPLFQPSWSLDHRSGGL